MAESSGLPIRGGLMRATVALFAWFGFSAGIYAILTEAAMEGVLWIVLTIAASIVLLRGSAAAERSGRSIPLVLWIFVALYGIVVGATRVYNALITDIQQLGAIQVPELFQAISAVIYLVLLAAFLWQLFKSYRPRHTV